MSLFELNANLSTEIVDLVYSVCFKNITDTFWCTRERSCSLLCLIVINYKKEKLTNIIQYIDSRLLEVENQPSDLKEDYKNIPSYTKYSIDQLKKQAIIKETVQILITYRTKILKSLILTLKMKRK